MNRAVFFDRDGVLNADVGYPHRLEDLRWMPGAREAVRRVKAAGRLAVVVTNQSGVARGFYGLEEVDRFHSAMQAELAEFGARIDAFYVCPYHPEATVERWRHPNHPDRKPNPGMLLRALQEHAIDASRSVLIGDKATDLNAAHRAGVRGVLYGGGDLAALVDSLVA